MSLVGNLGDLPLTDILQIVSLSRKSGILGLAREGAGAKIYFRNGLVIAAKVSDFPLDLGAFLTRKGLLTVTEQMQMRERVRQGESMVKVLTDDFAVSDKIIEGFAKASIEKVVYRLFTWQEGAFEFDLRENGEPSADVDPLLPYLEPGVNPQFLAMEGARLKDESDYFTTQGLKTKSATGLADDGAVALAPSPAPIAEPVPERTQPVPQVTSAPSGQPDEAAAPRALQAETGGVAGPKPVVLLIDNDVVALRNIEGALQRAGYEVASFTRVEAGIKAARELLAKGRGQIMLADLVMPKRDASGMLGGLEVLEVLRGEEQHVPVVLLADLSNPEAEKRANELGVDGYLSKPSRKFYVKDGDNESPEFAAFVKQALATLGSLCEKAMSISASRLADPFVDLGSELQGELEAATSAVSAAAPTGYGGQLKSRGLDMLKEMVRELNDPHFNADVSLLILRFAVELMPRAVIFVVGNNEVIGLGQAGVDRPDANLAVRKMRVPLTDPSIFADVVRLRTAVKRRLDSSKWNRELLDTLGGAEPSESFAAPVFTSRRLAAIIYGDNAGVGTPIGDTDSLEIFLSHAGIAMERALLERRLRDLTAGQRINYSD